MSAALRGHVNLRTRIVPIALPTDERERCTNCNAVLRSSNHGLCAPCAGVTLPELPDWMWALIHRGGTHGLNSVAAVVSGVKRPSRWGDYDARDAEIIERAQAGESIPDMALDYGISATQLYAIVRGDGRDHHKSRVLG